MSEAMSPLTPATATATEEEDQNRKVEAVVDMKKPAISKRFLRAKKTRVLVLGAGMSGLACARELQQRGYRVLVVEARDRPGGRLKGGVKTNDKEGGNEGMKTLPTSIISPDNTTDVKPNSKSRNKKETTTPIDLGGALIHGIDNNPVYTLTQQMGIQTQAVSECLLFSQTGWPLDTKEDERISAIFNECLEETFDRVAKGNSENDGETSESKSSGRSPTESASAATEAASATTSVSEAPTMEPSKDTHQSSEPAKRDHKEMAKKEAATLTDKQPTAAVKDEEKENEVSTRKDGKRRPTTRSHESGVTTRQSGKATSNPKSAVGEENKESRVATRLNGRTRLTPVSTRQNEKPRTSPEKTASILPTMRKRKVEAQAETPEVETAEREATAPSFGDVFDKVCSEKGAPTADTVFQWHQANLEVSCGASFPDLGYKWNDDEPYGFDGDHVALKTSWKPVMECMAEGIDVLYQKPVKKVVMVVPDPPPEPPAEPELEPSASLQTPVEQSTPTPTTPASSPSPKRKRKRTPSATPLPSRRSRRLVGDDPTARRSSRANKGQKVDRFLVSEFSRGSYEAKGSAGKNLSPRKRQEESESEDVHTTVQVTLEDGTVLEAEAVVCTLPLGILKLEDKPKAKTDLKIARESADDVWDESSGAITFYPPLPERKQTAIRRLGCGLLNKCVLSFSHVFWQDSDFLGLAHPANSYLVLNAARFTNKPILTFMYGGEFAEQIESWTDNEIVGDCMEVIRIICGRRDIPAPLDYAVTRWGQERYSRMSFSYVPPGVDGMEEFKAMSEAVYDPLDPKKPVIMFAGEHTTPFHPSTMHGAFFSGVREAYRLDLVVEAEANENLQFDDEQLYQHTFGVRRLFPAPRSPVARAPSEPAPAETTNRSNQTAAATNQKRTRRQHRRRGAASVMSLRQRLNTTPTNGTEPAAATRRRRPQQQEDQGRSRGAVGTNGSYTPARRSRRSVYSMAEETSSNAAKKAPTTDQEEELQRKKMASLESRTLMRALESYGHNYSYIQSVVLPIFGSGVPPKTVPQLRARCQQMIRSILSAASAAIPKRVLASWVPKEVYLPPPPTPPGKKKKGSRGADLKNGKHPARARSTNTPKPPAEGTRRSSRQPKQRQVMNL